jgi:hypothetical protein
MKARTISLAGHVAWQGDKNALRKLVEKSYDHTTLKTQTQRENNIKTGPK